MKLKSSKLISLTILLLALFLLTTSAGKKSKDKPNKGKKSDKKQKWNNVTVKTVHGKGWGSEGRIRRSAKYTDETLAIGRESFNNLKKYEANKNKFKGRAIGSLKNLHPKCKRPTISCDKKSKYRTIDGRCNNLKHKEWGSSFIRFIRLVPADYSDGFNRPRGLFPQTELPNARLVSLKLHADKQNYDHLLSNWVPQVGQFLDHDLALTPEGDRRCCTTEPDGIDCWPIDISDNDDFYANLDEPQECMDFTRSTAFCFPSSSSIREQFNINTAFMDASHIYGSDDERANVLREFSKGRLLENEKFQGIAPTLKDVGRIKKKNLTGIFQGSLIAGDNRINETPGLTVMHSLWIREHNRIAALFHVEKPKWNDEKIYQEARRIVTAEWQNIMYGEFLPVVMGPKSMKDYKLELGGLDSQSTYIDTLDPGIYHAFATAAYRFGHTMVNGLYELFKNTRSKGSFRMKDTYFNTSHIESNDAMDITLEGLMHQRMQKYDRHIAVDLTNFLFKTKSEQFGADLAARNIQRGRDHGIASYSTYREICGLSKLTKWDTRPKEISTETWAKLKEVYAHPIDIDLFTGGIVETAEEGVTGPLFTCLKGMQFYTMKFGDRFFFTHKGQAGSFTKEQLVILRRRTMGDVMCENTNIKKSQLSVFTAATRHNYWRDCDDETRPQINVKDFI